MKQSMSSKGIWAEAASIWVKGQEYLSIFIFHFCLQVVVRLKTHLGPWANERIARPIVFIWTILPTKTWVQFWGGSIFTRVTRKDQTSVERSGQFNSLCYRCVDTNILGPHWHKWWQAWTEQRVGCVCHITVKSKRQTYKLEQVQTPTLSHQILFEVSPWSCLGWVVCSWRNIKRNEEKTSSSTIAKATSWGWATSFGPC